jgi:hypothetical protein
LARRDGTDETPLDNIWDGECPECRQLRLEGHDHGTFVVTPAGGGGWDRWAAALLRMFRRIGGEPTQAVVINQDTLTDRYAQVLIGHGIAHAEASSNLYLIGESRLSAEHEDLLGRLGWLAPLSDDDDPDEMPANWHVPLVHGDWQYLVEMIIATIAGVFGFDAQVPIEVRSFQIANPCRRCSWDDMDDMGPR